ncbi:MAG: hypothetical protein P4L76_16505 [Beijerinckiaceae bacterium]|nr:hypothetical protein [Beijerinckiaceae bacterium]
MCALPGGAAAQLQLPGAVHGDHKAPARKVVAPRAAPEPVKLIPVTPPAEETLLGQTLTYDGSKGVMRFNRAGKNIVLSRLTLPGERLSKPGEYCEVNIEAEQPVAAAILGHPEGALRWSFALEACPFTADVLDGAVLVSSPHPTCDFVAADCRVSPVGLWGPPGDSIPDRLVKTLERERLQAEAALRTNFKVLVLQAGNDKEAVKAVTAEQAAFSAERDMTCHDYKGEAEHGFCAAQITQARSLALAAEYAGRVAEENARKAEEAAKKAEEVAKKAADEARKAAEIARKAAERAKANAAKAPETPVKDAKAPEPARQETPPKQETAPKQETSPRQETAPKDANASPPSLAPVASTPLDLLPKNVGPPPGK